MAGVNMLYEEMPWTANLLEQRQYLFDTGFLSDATLYIGPQKQEVKVHRLFLEMASPTFYRDFQQMKNNELIVEDVDPKIFHKFLRYIYLGECEAAVEECLPLMDIATKYKVENLMEFCTEKLKGDISLENLTTLFQQAMELGYQSLTAATLAYFCKEARKLIKTDYFLELRQECLYEILKQDNLSVRREMDLFNAVLRWGEAECQLQKLDPEMPENLGNILAKVLGLVRFQNMAAEEFSLNVATRKLLSNDELISLILFFNVSIEKRNEIPQRRFNANPRKYFKIDKTKIYTVSRGHQYNHIAGGVYSLEVSKKISLVGFKLFVHPDWKEDVRNDFSNFSCTILIESVPSGTFLHKKETKGFNFFETMKFESVELKPNSLYQINLFCSGTYRWSDTKDYNSLYGSKGLRSSCDLEYEGEEGTENVHFKFSRGNSSQIALDEGTLKELMFTIEE